MKIVILLLFLFMMAWPVSAALRINEIYPAPASGEPEWVELYNDSEEIIITAPYTLTDLLGNKIKITDPFISPFSFLIATASGVLNNSGDTVFLKNILDDSIQIATYSGTFTAIDSYGSCPDGRPLFGKFSLITKNTSNVPACITLTPTLMPTPTPTTIRAATTTPTQTPSLITIRAATPTPKPTPIVIAGLEIIGAEPTPSPEPEVLGIETKIPSQPPPVKSVSKTLSLVSIVYSLLTASSIFVRMKFG